MINTLHVNGQVLQIIVDYIDNIFLGRMADEGETETPNRCTLDGNIRYMWGITAVSYILFLEKLARQKCSSHWYGTTCICVTFSFSFFSLIIFFILWRHDLPPSYIPLQLTWVTYLLAGG